MFKSSILNKSVSLLKKRKLQATFLELRFDNVMVRLLARQSSFWNILLTGKVELTRIALETAPINDNNILFHTLALSYFLTCAPILPFALAKLVAKDINMDLQKITKLALKLFV